MGPELALNEVFKFCEKSMYGTYLKWPKNELFEIYNKLMY